MRAPIRLVLVMMLPICGCGGADNPSLVGPWPDDGKGDAGPAQLLQRLSALPDVSVVDLGAAAGGACHSFRLRVGQPVDHDDPQSPRFTQRVDLLHCGTAAPTVFSPDGYGLDLDGFTSEITSILGANQISVEHRYFSSSHPDSDAQARFLDIRQAAADHHHVVQLLRSIYSHGAWISTGASKGGMTSVFHRRYYPDDVDGTVAYVAPFMNAPSDPRFPAFFDTVGEPACRDALRGAQRAMLAHRDELEARMGNDPWRRYQKLGVPVALEAAVTLYSWFFWSYGGACNGLPDAGSSADSLLNALDGAGALDYGSDARIADFLPFSLQSVRELGFPKRAVQGLEGLLRFDPDGDVALRVKDYDSTYDPTPMSEVRSFIANDARRIVFIYGSVDPWTTGAADLGVEPATRELAKVLAPGSNHGAHIADLSEADQHLVLDLLGRWARSNHRLYAAPIPLSQRLATLRHRADLLPPPRAARVQERVDPPSP